MIRGSIQSEAPFLYAFFVGSLCFLACVYVPYFNQRVCSSLVAGRVTCGAR